MPSILATAALAWATLGAAPASAQSFGLCERHQPVTAGDQDLILRFTATVMRELDRAGSGAALVSRAGTDLRRFGIRYSHAGLALRDNPEGAWAVRQLYYVCDESRPRLFDQGMAGFLLAGQVTGTAYVSIVTLPDPKDTQLRERALDKAVALKLLGADYSANAYAYATRYQNCNQWVAEMLAAAWETPGSTGAGSGSGRQEDIPVKGGGAGGDIPSPADISRARAQRWLKAQAYEPTNIQVNSHGLMFIGQWVPLLHVDDHPLDDLYALRMRVSLPDALERFLRQQASTAQRVELCLKNRRIVVHRGWTPLGDDCTPASPADEVQTLD